jgi:hypothetical protein
VTTEPETEIVSDTPVRLRCKAAKKVAAIHANTKTELVKDELAEPVSGRLANQAQPEQSGGGAEEIRELVVEKLPLNPRMVWASYEGLKGEKQLVKVWVGVNRNFKPRMILKATRPESENAPWRLVGRRPRLPGRW